MSEWKDITTIVFESEDDMIFYALTWYLKRMPNDNDLLQVSKGEVECGDGYLMWYGVQTKESCIGMVGRQPKDDCILYALTIPSAWALSES